MQIQLVASPPDYPSEGGWQLCSTSGDDYQDPPMLSHSRDWPVTQLQNVRASGSSLSDVRKVTQQTEITLSPLNTHRIQPHTYHSNGAAKVQNPVLQCEVEPEVKVEGSRVVCLLSLRRAMPGGNKTTLSPLFSLCHQPKGKTRRPRHLKAGHTCHQGKGNPESGQKDSGFQCPNDLVTREETDPWTHGWSNREASIIKSWGNKTRQTMKDEWEPSSMMMDSCRSPLQSTHYPPGAMSSYLCVWAHLFICYVFITSISTHLIPFILTETQIWMLPSFCKWVEEHPTA